MSDLTEATAKELIQALTWLKTSVDSMAEHFRVGTWQTSLKPAITVPQGSSEQLRVGMADLQEPEYPKVRDAILALTSAKGQSVTLGVLERFGVKHGKELKPIQYVKVVEACKAAMLT